ncbi:MAG: HIT domain-containing protein [Parcubacteria group bacterium]|nr:HIT domain-containing protein [Parcubacteria group bacterium]
MSDCIFCDIVASQQESTIIFTNDAVIVIRDIHPKAPIHLLVISKKHVPSLNTLADADHEIVTSMIFAARDVSALQGVKGYKLVCNVGREGGQIIDHLHMHVLGGWTSGERKTADV